MLAEAGASKEHLLRAEIFITDRQRALSRFQWLDQALEGKHYLMGERYSVADAHLFVVCSWGPLVGVDLSGLLNLQALLDRVSQRPAVERALKAEGLR